MSDQFERVLFQEKSSFENKKNAPKQSVFKFYKNVINLSSYWFFVKRYHNDRETRVLNQEQLCVNILHIKFVTADYITVS